MGVLKIDFYGNNGIGLYCYCTDSYCLVGQEVSEHDAREVGKALGVPVHQLTVCGTSLLGVFLAGNSNALLVPEIAFDYELKALEKLGITHRVIRSHLTALGNNILCNDTGCLVNPEYDAEQRKAISKALGVPVKIGRIAGIETVGSLAALNSTAVAVHRDITEKEAALVEDVLGIPCVHSTVNMGSPYIRSGLVCNSRGFAIGASSSGPEVNNIESELGYLEDGMMPRKVIK
jgi:translation initiation factor 6